MKVEINTETASKISDYLAKNPGWTINNVLRTWLGLERDSCTREHSPNVGSRIRIANDVADALKAKYPDSSLHNAIRIEFGLNEMIKNPMKAFREVTIAEVRSKKFGDVIELDMGRISHLPVEAKEKIGRKVVAMVMSYCAGTMIKFNYEWTNEDVMRMTCIHDRDHPIETGVRQWL